MTLSKIIMTVMESYVTNINNINTKTHSSDSRTRSLSLCSCEMTKLESVLLFPPTVQSYVDD